MPAESDTKVTTRMPSVHEPIVREDSVDESERNVPDPTTYRLVKQYVQQNEERERITIAIEAQKAEERLVENREHNRRYNGILKAVQTSATQLRQEFAREIQRVDGRIDDVEALALRVERKSDGTAESLNEIDVRVQELETIRAKAQKRNEFLAATSPALVPPWELGTASDTGSHRIIPTADFEVSQAAWDAKFDDALEKALEAKEVASKADKWTSLVKWIVAALGVIFTGVLVVVISAALAAHPSAPALTPGAAPKATP